jgi:hypothetical protein
MPSPSFDPQDVLDRLDALESGLTLQQLPLEPLKTFLESDWQPDSGLLLQPASIGTDLLADASVTTAQLADGEVTDTKLATRIVRGEVTSAGAINLGAGFSVTRTGTGAYSVTFTTAFAAIPVVTAQAMLTAGALVSKVASRTASGFTVAVFTTTTGANTDGAFSFIAVAA